MNIWGFLERSLWKLNCPRGISTAVNNFDIFSAWRKAKFSENQPDVCIQWWSSNKCKPQSRSVEKVSRNKWKQVDVHENCDREISISLFEKLSSPGSVYLPSV